MRDHELDLIAALADGSLEDETEARALLDSSPDARAEYEAQKTAFEVLSAAGPAALTESERAGLHRDVWTNLRTPATKPATTPWYYRWAPALAGLFVVVGVVAVINQTGFGGEDAADETVTQALTGEATATTAAADSAANTLSQAEGAEEDGTDVTEAEADDSETTGGALSPDEDAARMAEPPAPAVFAAQAENIRSGEETEAPFQPYSAAEEEFDLPDCLAQAGLEGYEVHETYEAQAPTDDDFVDIEGEEIEPPPGYIAAVPEDADLSSAPIVFVDLATCEVVHVDE